MVDRERLARYIRELETYLHQVAELQHVEKQVFLKDWKVHDLAERKLHLILETYLSIGDTIISEYSFRKPDTYADIPRILGDNNGIPPEHVETLVDLAKFRNVLVHEYLALDHRRVYEHLQTSPSVIREFIDHIRVFLRRGRQAEE
jgi:uncharacterized protein YutE (UPF0331/DUF86 family)